MIGGYEMQNDRYRTLLIRIRIGEVVDERNKYLIG